MKYPINFKNITPKLEFFEELVANRKEAENYLMSFRWCKEIKGSSVYTNIGKVFCIFLFEIDNTASNDDDFLWVIVEDIPAMYLDTHGPKSTIEVLEDYIRLAEDWIDHVKTGLPVAECYPFDAEPTLELAELLEKRTSFMKNTLLQNIDDIPLKIK